MKLHPIYHHSLQITNLISKREISKVRGNINLLNLSFPLHWRKVSRSILNKRKKKERKERKRQRKREKEEKNVSLSAFIYGLFNESRLAKLSSQ